ncbi:hypothetical protein [Cerasicoccus fimbriatus]|uniref:hypothetical protein n=1 Tax=Cerasicoccus fimbriatus TaxID=3014554 RepID=UPI0022B3B224|nr:hypothetical protein [Cerasicoccus sp. TK19100]
MTHHGGRCFVTAAALESAFAQLANLSAQQDASGGDEAPPSSSKNDTQNTVFDALNIRKKRCVKDL